MSIFSILIFGIVLLVYLHVFYQLKTSSDREIYDLGDVSKDKLEEICDYRQPIICNYTNHSIIEKAKEIFLDEKGKYKNMKFNIYSTNRSDTVNDGDEKVQTPVVLTFENTKKLFKDDDLSRYHSRNNEVFLKSSGLYDIMNDTDTYLKPSLVSLCNYDVELGSNNATSNLRYNVDYRNFFSVLTGKIKVKLIAPKYLPNLHERCDYYNFDFTSPINAWNVQNKYTSEMKTVDIMDITVHTGQMIYIPAYWWYSIQYEKTSIVAVYKYRTYMNDLAILPRLVKSLFQRHNVKHKPAVVKQTSLENSVVSDADKNKVEKNPVSETTTDTTTETATETITNTTTETITDTTTETITDTTKDKRTNNTSSKQKKKKSKEKVQ